MSGRELLKDRSRPGRYRCASGAGGRQVHVHKRKRQTNTAAQATMASTTAAVNALLLPSAFRACSISFIEVSRLPLVNVVGLTRAKIRRSYSCPGAVPDPDLGTTRFCECGGATKRAAVPGGASHSREAQ